MFMNNFTKSNGKAYWQSITNLACCVSNFTRDFKLSAMSSMLVMLFLFSVSTLQAQKVDQLQQRTTDLPLCYDQIPDAIPVEDIALLYEDQCGDLDPTVVIVEETFTGDDCGWEAHYLYFITCGDFEAFLKIEYNGFDQQDPVIDLEAKDLTVECDGQGNLADLQGWLDSNGGATASDNCDDELDWSNDFEGLSDDCGETGSVTVTFTATDECGMSVTTEGTFTIEDTVAPSIDGGGDLTVECDGQGNGADLQAWLDSNAGASASDLCGDVTWSNDYEELSDGCGETGSVTVEFTATDSCGNNDKVSFTFTIEDTTNPTIDQEASDMTVECDGNGNGKQLEMWLNTNGGAVASDLCGEVTWSKPIFNGLSDDCGETGSGEATFTAVDECGNSITTSATFTIEDTTDPVITGGSDMTVECDGAGNAAELQAWLDSAAGASASDTCGDVTWSNDYDGLSDDCGATGSATVEFTATDDCGNDSKVSFTFTIEDTTDPVIEGGSDMTVECDGAGNAAELQAWLDSNAGASASDACGDVTWSNDFDGLSDDCGETGSATVEFTATDSCGNDSKVSFTFTIEDTTNPKIEGGSDLTVECDGQGNLGDLQGWLDSNAGATATDACGDITWSNDFDGLSDDCGETGSATVEFTATDSCGNTDKRSFTFTIEDTTDPTIDEEAKDLTVECKGPNDDNADTEVPIEDWLASNGGASASDLCGDVTWSNDFDTLSDDCGNTGSATVTFTATDSCGNTSTTSATYTIEDTTDPTIEVEAQDMTVECDGNGNGKQLEMWLNTNGGAVASDLCGEVTWSKPIFNGLSDDCGETGSGEATFTAVDECGNSSTTTATFTIEDTTDPVITGGSDMTVECDGQGNLAELQAWLDSNAGASASDTCGDVTWSNDFDGLSDDCGETGSATVEFTATDSCGNDSKVSFTFTIEDTTDPVIEGGSDMTVECDGQGNLAELQAWLDSAAGASASDACSDVVWSNDFDGLSDDCGETGSATVEFTATDRCGNDSKVSFTFTIEDTTDPVIEGGSDMTVECDGQGNLDELQDWLDSNAGASASDTCGDVTWSNDFSGLSDDCGETGSATVEFTATDSCGNDSKVSFTFTIEDTKIPVIEGGDDMTVECDGAGNLAELQAWLDSNAGASASDECGNVTWSNDFSGLSDDCGETGSATVEFTATDDCGNSDKVSYTFTIEDTTDPVIEGGSDMTVECDGAGNLAELQAWLDSAAGASASDTCGNVTWSNDYDGLSDDCGATGSATVEFTATDDCGNDSKVSFTFTIEDTTDPSIDTEAMDMTVECDGEGNQADLDAWLANNGGAVASDACGDVTWSYACGGTSTETGSASGANTTVTAIPDNNEAGTSTLADVAGIPAGATITDVRVNLSVEHTWVGDLKVDLTAPTGETLSLLDRPGSPPGAGDSSNASGAIDGIITFTDGASVLAEDMGATIGGGDTICIDDGICDYIPNEGGVLFADMIAEMIGNSSDPNGQWSLSVSDNALGDTGAFSWSIDIDYEVEGEGGECVLSDECGETGSVTVEFTATDSCGNTSKTTATFTVEDTTDPVITGGSDMTVECDGNGNLAELQAWLDSNAGASASDTCGDVTWSNDFDGLSDDCGETGSATVEFTATDSCGNDSKVSFTFTIEDTTDPVIEGGSDMTVECDGQGNLAELQAWLDSNAGASASDTCGDVTWSNDFSGLSDDCGETGSATVEFTATDDCGNDSKVSFTFTIEDTTDPVIDVEAKDETVECDGTGNQAELDAWLANNGGASASDLCGDVTWSHVCSNTGTGGSGTASGANGTVTAIPDNNEAGTSTLADVAGIPAGATITDVRVNLSVEHTWVGDLKVDLTAPTGETLSLLDRPGSPPGAGDSSDASGAIDGIITFTDGAAVLAEDMGATIGGGDTICIDDGICDYIPNEGGVLFADMIAEMIGNSSDPNGQWSLSVSDNALGDTGAFSWSIDVDYELDGEETVCVISDECGATGSVDVTFIATDSCGNTSETSATFTVEDTTAPVLVGTIPPSINDIDACMDDMPLPPTDDVIAGLFAEECGDVLVERFTSAVGDDCGWSVIHSYTVTDECGNPYDGEIKVYYSGMDETPPVLDGVPDDTAVECDSVPAPAEVTAFDECAGVLEVDYNENRIDGNCPNNYTLIRTWTAVDACGNEVSDSQTIEVSDTTAPELKPDSILPEGENFIDACKPTMDEAIANYGPSAAEVATMFNDNCDDPVTVDKVVNINGDDCKWIMDIRYDIYDSCGNYYEPSIKIWFHGMDNTAPEQVGCFDEEFTVYTSGGADCPADAGFGLEVGDVITPGDDWTVAGLYVQQDLNLSIAGCFIDNCTPTQDLRFEVTDVSDEAEGCPKKMTITFNVLDACAEVNGTLFEGFVCTFYVVDDEAPVLDCPEGSDLGLNPALDANGIPYGLVDKVPYTDNCDPDGLATDYTDDVSEVEDDGVPTYIDIVTDCWYVTFVLDADLDANGNPTWTGFFNGTDPGYRIAYNVVDGRWEQTEGGVPVYWDYTDDTSAPSCDASDYDSIDTLSCDPNTTVFYCSDGYYTQYKLVRTFTQLDSCGNPGTCDVSYTWTEGDIITSPNSSYPNDGSVTSQTGDTITAADDASGVELDFTAYPVPFDKEVNVKFNFEFDTPVTIEVHDTKGLLVYSETVSNVTKGMNTTKKLDLSNGADQIFYVTVHTNKGSVTKKLVSSGLKRR